MSLCRPVNLRFQRAFPPAGQSAVSTVPPRGAEHEQIKGKFFPFVIFFSDSFVMYFGRLTQRSVLEW